MTQGDRPHNPNAGDDEQYVARLVRDALAAPELREEFVEGLGKSLDAGLLARARSERANGASTLGALLDKKSAQWAEPVADDAAPTPASLQRERESPEEHARSPRVRLGRRLAIAAAVSMVLVVSLWSQPGYSWSRMIEAMGEQPWVRFDALRGDGGVVQWLSPRLGVEAVRSPRGVSFTDRPGDVMLVYDADGDRIVQSPLGPDQRAADMETHLVTLLANRRPREGFDVVHQRADVRDAGVWLEVKIQCDDQLVNARFAVDPKTCLPESCELLDEEPRDNEPGRPAAPPRTVQFTYPQDGPTSIYSLGAPQDAEVIKVDEPGAAPPRVSRVDPPTPPAPPATRPDPLPEPELVSKVDAMLAERWAAIGVTPVGAATDEEFLRRAYLDLTGRIPTVGEARMFLEDQGDDRRKRLVEELLASRDHATHLAVAWRKVLIPAAVDLAPYGGPQKLDEWLADRFQQNLPYDQLTRELLTAEGRISESGPLLFYAALKLNPEEIAAQTSRAFLGTQLDCAQCHDHPFDGRVSQEDFWSFAALFARISRPQGMMEVTSPVMRVEDNRRGDVTLPDTEQVVAPRMPMTDHVVSDAPGAPPRRRQFVDWLTSTDNDQFARATVNRVWAHLFGRGLVEPVDDIREENPAIAPEVLGLLTDEFINSGYDVRRLIRSLVSTRAYQLTSRSEEDDPARALAFAQMNVKPLTAEQLYDCILVASASAPNLATGLTRTGDAQRDAFVELFAAPGGNAVDYQAGIPQALGMMHGGLVHGATDVGLSGLLAKLRAPFFTDEQRLETLFLATLSRMPREQERQTVGEYLAGAQTNAEQQQRLGDVLWSLLNTAEFTLNH